MATATRKCKVCGVEYEYCHTNRRVAGVFRWQDVACCPKHGSIYFADVMASRSKEATINKAVAYEAESVDNASDIIDDSEYDELFEEGFDDDTDEPAIET